MRLIDSDALFHDRLSTFKDSDGEHYLAVSEVVKMIKLAPTVDAIPITYLRAWLDNDKKNDVYLCGKCRFPIQKDYNYCPICRRGNKS